jgi:hypothetical protein
MKLDSPSLDNTIETRGSVLLEAWKNGRTVRRVRKSNLITTRGLIVMARTISEAGTGVTHIATGSDNTSPSISDTALGSEAYRDQVTQYQRPGDGSVTFKLFIGPASANGTTIKEAGLLNASTGGELVARIVFSASEEIVKTSDITAQISWTITFS